MPVDRLVEELARALRPVVAEALASPDLAIEGLTRLSGGASRETWSFGARLDGREVRGLVLRRDPPGAPGSGMGREARLLSAAADAGVPVPRIVAASDDPGALGSSFIVMDRVEGETIPRRILRDDAFAAVRPVLAAQCAEALAGVHRIPAGAVPGLERTDQVARFRELLDQLGEPHPAFELGFRWLEANRVGGGRTVVVHGDFRNGNLIVGPDGLRAVLDWELAHLGDPLEDLGWMCVKSWRFGEELPVGGFGTYDQLVGAYERASGQLVDRAALRWWETLGTLKWGIMCIMQAATHTSGAVRSVELAAIGRRVCEVEWDLLALVAPGPVPELARADAVTVVTTSSSPHDSPSAAALTEAVREFLEHDVFAATEGRVRFHTRVAVNVLGMVERELALGPGQAHAHAAALAQLGLSSEAELAAAIRSGALDDRLEEMTTIVRDTVEAKLAVANPRYLGDVPGRLHAHLREWLGHWPPAPGEVVVVGTPARVRPGWDGGVRPFLGVADTQGVVLSVPPGAEAAVRQLGLSRDDLLSVTDDAEVGEQLAHAVGRRRGRLGRGCFRWSARPADLADAGEWVPRSDPRVPTWLHGFNGDVLIVWDDEGRYGAGVGRKLHDQWGHELAVATEEPLRGRGIARRLVAQAARRVLHDGAVPTYLHDFDNLASARVADAAGFPDRGWQFLSLSDGQRG